MCSASHDNTITHVSLATLEALLSCEFDIPCIYCNPVIIIYSHSIDLISLEVCTNQLDQFPVNTSRPSLGDPTATRVAAENHRPRNHIFY